MRLDHELLALAVEQRACVARWQARDLGATRTEIDRLRTARLWTPVNRAVVAIAGVEIDDGVRTSANVLAAGPGAFLSHGPGARWFGHLGFALLPSSVSQRSGRATRVAGSNIVHDLLGVPPRWITVYEGVAVARPELVAYQLCGTCRPERAERVLDALWSMGLLTIASARVCLEDLAEHGRNGTVVFRELLRSRNDEQQPYGSGLESRVCQIAREAGFTLRRQVDSGGDQWSGRVDFRDIEVPRFALEVHSRRYHAALSYQRDDAVRLQKLKDDGLEVRVVWDDEVWTRPGYVVDVIREGRMAARRPPPSFPH